MSSSCARFLFLLLVGLSPGLARSACPDPLGFGAAALALSTHPASGCIAPAGVAPCADHHVITPAPVVRDGLWVFLPGTGMEPDKHDQLAQIAAYAGYRAVVLSYDTTSNMNAFCLDKGDPTCHGQVRDAALFGGTVTLDGVSYTIDAQQSVTQRLLDLLVGTPWGLDYLVRPPVDTADIDAIDWSRIALGGFSMGAGNAARLAMHQSVQSVWMVDGVKDPWLDGTGTRQYATWTQEPSETASCRFYAAYHRSGNGVTDLEQQLTNLGIGLSSFDADAGGAWADEARVSTAQLAVAGGSFHSSMATDHELPTGPASGLAALSIDQANLFEAYLSIQCATAERAPLCEAPAAVASSSPWSEGLLLFSVVGAGLLGLRAWDPVGDH